ncbi:hypothetical protein OCV77_00465 [Suilimivivens aceti]|uniref:Uncharacterized protein n=1 Tax=Suilimivivens aceti TaxID=2981774 RepID=A0ABT2SYB8_9FIRM|nr:hypothetical protein [Suilimivivens aceti]MCU6742987.1 hypothetical protein [Suilimivivens aceti]SCG95815.1 Uncharacterised protein [uncultured Clostridium sp.]
MKKKNITRSVLSLLLVALLGLSVTGCGKAQAPTLTDENTNAEASASARPSDTPAEEIPAANTPASDSSSAVQPSSALPVKALHPKQVEENPYMAKSDANIHHDGYNTDSTDEILPLGIYPEINVSYETTNANASPAIYFDSYGHAVVPLLGGIAIRDLNAEETQTLGYFSPKQHDGGEYIIQSSYTFLDSENRIVCPTSNNHVLMLRTTDEDGNVLPEFEKVLDIDIKAASEAALGRTLEQNLLSVVFDYEGNLWFATGGFRIYPERKQQGVVGYIDHEAIDTILVGGQADLSKAVYVHELTPGEGAENGIAASREGAVILTNQNCYLLRAENGVEIMWCTPYESIGAKVSGENDKTTGGGLAWGGGCSPSLTPNLVMFTDNRDPVNLLALDMKTGTIVAECPVLDDLPDGYQVAVENSAIVYDDGEGTVSTIVCNWFGAGNAGLADPDNDSSIQSYANIYDTNWLTKGNIMIAPGVERIDTVKTKNGYEMKSIWCRNDLSDTSILKLSTATGYIYGYVQDLGSGMWQYIILDFETGETVFTMDVSNKYGYNNMAIGMYTGNSGNALYCPTGYLELLRLQDRFAYLPEMPYRKIDLDQASRHVLSQEQFTAAGGAGSVAGWLNTISIRNVHPNTTVAFRMNNLSGSVNDLTLYAYNAAGILTPVASELWKITSEDGQTVTELTDGTLYEVRITVADNGDLDLNEVEKEIRLSAVLGK